MQLQGQNKFVADQSTISYNVKPADFQTREFVAAKQSKMEDAQGWAIVYSNLNLPSWMIEAGKRLEMGKGKLDIWRSLSQLVPQGTDSVADCINLFNFYQLYYVNILGNPPYDSSYSKAILAAWAAKYPKFGAEQFWIIVAKAVVLAGDFMSSVKNSEKLVTGLNSFKRQQYNWNYNQVYANISALLQFQVYYKISKVVIVPSKLQYPQGWYSYAQIGQYNMQQLLVQILTGMGIQPNIPAQNVIQKPEPKPKKEGQIPKIRQQLNYAERKGPPTLVSGIGQNMVNIQPQTQTDSKVFGKRYDFKVFDKLNPQVDRQTFSNKISTIYAAKRALRGAVGTNSNLGQSLFLFPNWAMKSIQNQKQAQQNQKRAETLTQQIQKQDSTYMKQLQNSNKNLQWDENKQQWVGLGATLNRIAGGISEQRVARIGKQVAKSGQIINQTADRQMIEENVPSLVGALIRSNEQLSSVGIGPIKQQGIPLYAGRWVDPQTGRVRMLPKANNKYINPLSYKQKTAYLEARILNKWNQYVDSNETYFRHLQTDPAAWKESVIKKFRSLTNWKQGQKLSFKKISKAAQAASLGLLGEQYKTNLWDELDTAQVLTQIGRVNKQNVPIAQFLAWFSQKVKSALDVLINPATKIVNIKLATYYSRLLQYASSLIDSEYLLKKDLASKLAKAVFIPPKISGQQMEQIQQKIEEMTQQLADRMQKGSTITNQELDQLTGMGEATINEAQTKLRSSLKKQSSYPLQKYFGFVQPNRSKLKTVPQYVNSIDIPQGNKQAATIWLQDMIKRYGQYPSQRQVLQRFAGELPKKKVKLLSFN